jgi:hypothetical protein
LREDLPTDLERVLRQRGFVPSKWGDRSQFINTGDAPDDHWVSLLDRAECRKLLKRIIAARGREIPKDVGEGTLKYVARLHELGIVKIDGERVSLSKPVDSFGPTFEWYVARVVARDFAASADWAVTVEEIYGGGDFDVLGWLDTIGVLMYVECKTTRPNDLTEVELRNFLQRSQELAPEISVLLVDTDSELEPLIQWLDHVLILLVREASGTGPQWIPEKPLIAPVYGSEYAGISFGQRRVFVTGSEPSVATQLRKCVRYYSTVLKHATFLSGPRMDFIHGGLLEPPI